MFLAVKLYSTVAVDSKPNGIPDTWPAEVRELGESTTLPSEDWQLMTAEEYAIYVASVKPQYNAWLAAQNAAAAPAAIVNTRVESAMNFGRSIIIDFATSNVLAGKTVEEVKQIASKFSLIQSLLMSGSLYVALAEIQNITPDQYVDQATIDKYANKIKAYLGIP